ncbi:hypothetical protein BBP40_001590 [Aspergillus hancockii]|nr:hypothetical protein BBP40_001590 [Aspergillus hancockii]
MSSSLRHDFLPSIQALLLDSAKVTVLVSETQFDNDLSTSQDVTLAVLAKIDVEIRCLLRRILQPLAHPQALTPIFASVLEGCMDVFELFERLLQQYKSTSPGRQYVCSSWTQLMETLQHYTMNLHRLIAFLDPVSYRPISNPISLQRVFDCQKNDVQRALQAQIRFEEQLGDASHTQVALETEDDDSPSSYATPPSSIADGDVQEDPLIPGFSLPPSSFLSAQQKQQQQHPLHHCQNAIAHSRETERAKIYNTLKAIWIPEHEAPEKRSSHLLHAIELKSVDGVNLLLDLGAEVNRLYDKDLPLCLAARHGCDEIVETLLNRGAEIDKHSGYGSTALISATGAGHTSTMVLLLGRNANKEAKSTSSSCKGYTPLMRAVREGHQHAIRLLVDQGADVATQSTAGESLLHVAIQSGRKETIDQVSRLNPHIGVSDKNGDTELHLAAKEGLLDVCKQLIRQMPSLVRTANHKQEMPLHCAVKTGRCDIVRLFLKKGAFAECPDVDGKTPLHYAVEAESLGSVKLLFNENASSCLPDRDGKTPIHYAVEIASKDILLLLAEDVTSVNVQDKNKETPLHYAVKSRNIDMVRILLSHNANASCKDRVGKTPLEYVMELPQSEEEASISLLQEFLLRHEKGQPLAGTFGFPVLSKAAREGKPGLIREICRHDPGLANEIPHLGSDFDAPLHEAIKFGHRDSVEMLCLLPQTDKNIYDREGNTPLHQAVIYWQDGLFAMLICKGADKNRPHGRTNLPPLHFAAQLQSLKKVQELLNNNADPDVRVEGEQCSWCRKHNRPAGMNSRCVLQAIPEKDRTPEWSSINNSLIKAIPKPSGPGSASSQSSNTRRRKGMYSHRGGSWSSMFG